MNRPLNDDVASDPPKALRLSVRFYEGLYHGEEWPPSPARLFQALVSGAGLNGPIGTETQKTLEWFESLDPPIMYAPKEHCRRERPVTLFVPQNDRDKVATGSKKASKLKMEKKLQPWFFNSSCAFHYVWRLDGMNQGRAQQLCALSERLYRLGHGVDSAFCTGEIIDYHDAAAESLQNTIAYSPSRQGRGGIPLKCPTTGTFHSLEERFHAQRGQLVATKRGRSLQVSRQQANPSRFRSVQYNTPSQWQVYSLRDSDGNFTQVPLRHAPQLARIIRTAAGQKLGRTLTDGVFILPLPSIGHNYADGLIRRIMVYMTGEVAIPKSDIDWCFSALKVGLESEESVMLQTEPSDNMIRHYHSSKNGSSQWFTVTPMVLSRRRRIEPERERRDNKDAQERNTEVRAAIECLLLDLVEAKIGTPVISLQVQPEPIHAKGSMAQAFASESGYSKDRLWHVKIEFQDPIKGFLTLGRGRKSGFGLFAPWNPQRGGGIDGI